MEGPRTDYYDAYVSSDMCHMPVPLYIFQTYLENDFCPMEDFEDIVHTAKDYTIEEYTLLSSIRVLPTIVLSLLGVILSQLLCNHLPLHSKRRFLLEFLLIFTPTICSNTVISDYNELYCLLFGALIVILLWRKGIWARALAAAAKEGFCIEIGRRPLVFTLMRAAAYICTGSAILAVDFNAFPSKFFKSQSYGASLMDVGIGMFVVTMGIVSHRLQHFQDLKKLPKSVAPLLLLGLIRTVIITCIDYRQDDWEYGRHLNAFFTLGFTKLFGSLCSLLAYKDAHLLPLSLGILALHELALQLGLSRLVMMNMDRDGFWSANREGLSSLPGCISLYLLSIYCAKWYMAKSKLNFAQFWDKLGILLLNVILGWILVVNCTFFFGIARVTFNSGYVFWLFSLTATLTLLCGFIFEFVLQATMNPLPAIVEAINLNGLTYFMLCNLFTGLVNMTMDTRKRNTTESLSILMVYLFSCTGAVFILFRKGIRIA